ncbi:hypothetical protein [Streptomyces sp. CB02923]|uniref:hypothetical protein n=1 Tax=Streptomyces sp. CB02923 TaxID=1718985 RepID=UPI0019028702|nr:hypothetical protein [Streptomyces sp. CB02923]
MGAPRAQAVTFPLDLAEIASAAQVRPAVRRSSAPSVVTVAVTVSVLAAGRGQ